MKKSYLVMAAAAALFAACSSNDLAEEKQSPQITQPTVEEQSVTFDAYQSRGTTRAGGLTALGSTTALKALGTAGGFGVFAYYTDGEPYSGITKPNFMYNQLVYWKTGTPSNWTYTPIKYWPNEFGSDAISDQVDRVTFFAYAPWVEVTPLTGLVKDDGKTDYETTNIIGMTRNTATGDPFIKYVATMDATNTTDLCYGVAAQNFTSSNSGVNANTIKKGDPYIDVKKPGIDDNSKIYFDFKHATAQLNVTIDAVVNAASGLTNAVDATNTRIWVRSVTFEGITQKGALNLNSIGNTPEWYDMNGNNKITTGSITVFDGRKDGKEALYGATNETPATLNPALVQSAPYAATFGSTTPAGVTNTTVNLFKHTSASTEPVYVIPTNEPMKVTIVYDVETYDENLAYYLSDGSTPGSTIENTITKTINAFGNISAGYHYTLNLHLGMRTVDFDAVVTDWQDINAESDHPSNVPNFVSGSDNNVTVPAGSDNFTYNFAITGLTANATTAYSGGDTWLTGATTASANASGIAKESITIAKNTTTSNRSNANKCVWTSGGVQTKLNFKQLAAPIGFTTLNVTNATTLTCDWSATDIANADAMNSAGYIRVYKNGVEITSSCTFSNSNKTITVPTLINTDVVKVVMQANDAAAESQTITVSTL